MPAPSGALAAAALAEADEARRIAEETRKMAGPAGPAGADGAPGEPGPDGPQGLQGEVGPVGPRGPKGDKGDRGQRGPEGPRGEKGEPGAKGPRGDKGDRGLPGSRGPKGAAGRNGKDGRSVLHGLGPPKQVDGDDGDFYIDQNTPEWLIYGPKADGQWPSRGKPLEGPPGLRGNDGAAGADGPQGPQGPAGPNQVTTSTATDLTGILKGDGANVLVAVSGTDYEAPGAAAAAIATHEGAYTHADIALNTAARHDAATVTGNGIGITGQQISLDIGTGAAQVAAGDHLHTGVYDPAGSAAAVASDLTTHEGLTDGAHGMSVFGASLVDDADAATARSTLGLGDCATKNESALDPANMSSGAATVNYVPVADGAGNISWAAVSGSGDVVGPGSATDNTLCTFDGATGKLIQDASGITAPGSGVLSGVLSVDSGAASDLELKYNGSTQLQISSTFSYLNNTLLFPSSADYIAVRNFGDTSYIQVFDVFASNELAVGYSSAHDGLVLGISSKPIYPYNGLTFWGGYFIDSGSANDLAFKRDGSTILTLESDGFTSLADTDAIYNAGRCKFGYVGGGYTDTAGFGHLDHFGPATVALRADSTGAVRLQSDGQTLWLVAGTTMEASAGGTDVFAFSSSLCQFKVNVIHGSGLYFRPADVTGQALGTTTYKWQVYTDYLYLAGNARILNNNPLTWRNAANSAWLTGIVINGSDELSVGYCTSVDSSAAKDLALKRNGSTIASVVSAGVNLASGKVLQVNGTQVVGARVVDGDLGNTPNTGDTDTDDMIQALADLVISHGLGATS